MKPQLLIIPGWGGTKTSWKNFMNLAQTDFDVYCFDLPCFGEEPCPTEIWGIEEYAEFVRKKTKNLNSVKPILLGHSFGGQIAAYLAANYPEEFSKLILSGAAILRQTPSAKKIIFQFLAKTGGFIFKLPLLNRAADFMKKALYRLANSDYNRTSGMKREIYQKIINQDLSALAARINLPTLIIWGENDGYVPLKQGKKLSELIVGSKLEIVPGGKHGLHLQTPEKLYGLVKNFIF